MTEEPSERSGACDGVPLELWERLYAAADQFRQLAPWQWMPEEAAFGVRFAGTDTIGFVSVMGAAGAHLACAVYLGWQALRDMREALAHDALSFDTFLEVPQLQLVFASRDRLQASDLAVIRALGRRYRGKDAWPLFRSHRVGYLPWRFDADEARLFHCALYQTLGVAMRCEDSPRLLMAETPDTYLVRGVDARGTWTDEWVRMPRLPPRQIAVAVEARKIAALRQAEPPCGCAQIDLLLSRALIGLKGERPQTAYMLLVVDAETGFVHNAELLQALQGIDAMWGEIPARLIDIFLKIGGCPRVIEVQGDRMMNVLRPLTEHLPFKLTRRNRLTQLEEVRESFDSFFGEHKDLPGSAF